jgi:hypothetical protein
MREKREEREMVGRLGQIWLEKYKWANASSRYRKPFLFFLVCFKIKWNSNLNDFYSKLKPYTLNLFKIKWRHETQQIII